MTALTARDSLWAGIRAALPLLMGIVPFGIVCGAAAVAAGLSPGQASALAWGVFAGSSQIVFTQLYASGAPAWVAVATGWVVNLRFMMYSAALAPHLREAPPRRRWLAAYLLTDQAFACTIARALEGRPHLTIFYLGIAATLWVFWQAANLIGIVAGRLIPAGLSSDFIVALTFISILVPLTRDRRMLAAALAGGIAAVLLDLPLKLNLMAAAAIGIAVGLTLEKAWPESKPGR